MPLPDVAPKDSGSEVGTAWHALPGEAVLERLETTSNGLAADEAARRRNRFGPNALPEEAGGEALRILFNQVKDPLIYVLLGSTGLAMATGKVLDGSVIAGVVVINALIGFFQEYRANRAIKALSGMVPNETTVLRDGRKESVPATGLVPGDVVLLQSGDKVPADLRLLEARGLQVEEAALTGESVPVDKGTGPVSEDTAIGDRSSVAFSGTLVTNGTGKGVVVAIGRGTELGRISRMLGEAGELETPLTRRLGVIARWIALAIVGVSVALLALGLFRGFPLADAVLAAVALAVAAIPEGLPAIVTISLAVGVQRMARRHAIMRKLPAVETLGSTTVICTDKTGTLTRNEMTVQHLWTGDGRTFRMTGIGYAPEGRLETAEGKPAPEAPEPVGELLRAGVLCSDAALRQEGEEWRVTGDPTEAALVAAAMKLGFDAEELRRRYPRLDAIPFESERQFMATLHGDPDGGRVIYLKGAPEVILQRCSTGVAGDNSEDADLPQRARQEVDRIADQGMRVLGFAARRLEGLPDRLDDDAADSGFVFLGLQGMIDPPRPEAIAAVHSCREAGITVKMITGDHRVTARAIGQQLGLIGTEEEALSGPDLDRMDAATLTDAAVRHHVFARVAPEHKLGLVKGLQEAGQIVAMTGDGVNDAPALKQANIGIAMGITGTSVSKEAADMVLTDDNFATIEAAVEEGRRVYDNLIKALAFVLPTNLGLAFILMAAVAAFPVAGGEALLPMQPAQILWINLVAAVALALPLAMEAMEPGLMQRSPRAPDAPVLSAFVVMRTVMVAVLMAGGALALFLLDHRAALGRGLPPATAVAEAQTEAVTAVIMFQIFYLLNCRSLEDSIFHIGVWTNPWIYGGIGTVLALQAGFIYAPLMNRIFGSAPLDGVSWLQAVAAGFLIMPIINVEKWIRRRYRSRKPA